MKRTHCPICAETTRLPTENDFFPFCGRRCRSADLGRWLDGEYRLSEEAPGFFEAIGGDLLADLVLPKGAALLVALLAGALMTTPALAQTDGAPASSATSGSATAADSSATATVARAEEQASPAPEHRSRPASDESDAAPVGSSGEDGGDHGIVYIGADFGYSWINLVQFSSNNFIPTAERLDGNGWSTALSAGFRVYWFTVGARGTLSSYPGFEIGTVGLDLGLHLPIPVIEPYVRGGLSYGWMGNANYRNPNLSDTSVTGLVADVGGGVDIYLSDHISLGAGIDAVFLNLTRQKITSGAATMVTDINVSESGDAVGLQLRFHGQLTIHI
jgi:endogenous inhibitor of DNA gyrase (YacG/DUF329 family)